MKALITYCPEHGLHGERSTCFVCDGPVEQIPMAEVPFKGRGYVISLFALVTCGVLLVAVGLVWGFALTLWAFG